MGSAYLARGELLWHPRYPLAIPDLAASGWERVSLDEADVAFRKNGSGLIAVRARCPARDTPLRWESRELWLGIPRESSEHYYTVIDGYEAVTTSAEIEGLRLRTLVARTEECWVDVVQVAPVDSDADAMFERFITGLRLGGEQ